MGAWNLTMQIGNPCRESNLAYSRAKCFSFAFLMPSQALLEALLEVVVHIAQTYLHLLIAAISPYFSPIQMDQS